MNAETKKFNEASLAAGFVPRASFTGELSKLENVVLQMQGVFEDGTSYSYFRAGDGFPICVIGATLIELPKGVFTLIGNNKGTGWNLFMR